MKRIASLLLLVALSACATTPVGPRPIKAAFAAPQSNVTANQLTIYKGTPPAPPAGTVAIISNDGTSLLQQNSDGTTSTLGGGGGSGGSVVADAPLTGNGTSGSHLAIQAATSGQNGYLASADKAKLDTYAGGGQFDQIALFAQSIDPALTACRAVPLLTNSYAGGTSSAPTTGASAQEGGGLKPATSATVIYVGPAIFQTPKTGHWFLAFRAALGGSGASGHDTQIGLFNSGASHAWQIERRNATSTTKYTLTLIGTSNSFTAGTASANNSIHTFAMWHTPGTVSMYVDPSIGSSADASAADTPMADEPMLPNLYSLAGSETDAQFFEYCYVAP